VGREGGMKGRRERREDEEGRKEERRVFQAFDNLNQGKAKKMFGSYCSLP
jgi:hypothetical protein